MKFDLEKEIKRVTDVYRAGMGLPPIKPEAEFEYDDDPDYKRQDAEFKPRRNMDHYLDDPRHGQGDK